MYRREDVQRWAVASVLAILLVSGGTIVAPTGWPSRPLRFPAPPNPDYVIEFPRTEPEHPREPEVARQIVTVYLPETEHAPEDARFEDRVNRDVEHETVARDQSPPGALAAAPNPEPQQGRQRSEQRDRDDVRPAEGRGGPPGEPAPEATEEQAAANEAPTEEGALPVGDLAMRQNPNVGPPGEQHGRIQLSEFAPTQERAGDFIGVPGATMDHLDLPQGERTEIDSIENQYWSYWERIKNQVRPHWQPASVYRAHDPTGRIYGVEDRYTVLRVTLNGDGSLRYVYLERSSDLDFLDREAMRAIREAEPFSNVPEGLKDDDTGLLSFRFGFYFEVASSSFRIRREDW